MRNSDDAGHILQENIVPATLVRNSQIIENVVRGDDGRVPGARDSHVWGSSAGGAGAGGQILDRGFNNYNSDVGQSSHNIIQKAIIKLQIVIKIELLLGFKYLHFYSPSDMPEVSSPSVDV